MKTIYKNGAVYTGKLPLVEAFAVEDGKFVFAGSSAEADALAAAGDKVVDLSLIHILLPVGCLYLVSDDRAGTGISR